MGLATSDESTMDFSSLVTVSAGRVQLAPSRSVSLVTRPVTGS
jgi:hypothetical protein